MIAALALLNANKNIVLVLLGVIIVAGSYMSGKRAVRNEIAAETAEINQSIVETRGKDEAEIAAQEKAAETVDAAVREKLKQTLILDGETARWLGLVK